jgi:3-hydroxyisobutyrate dehydrogenase
MLFFNCAGVNAARQALLTFMVGGPESKFPEAQEILQNMGKNVVHCGAVGTGQVSMNSEQWAQDR